MGATTVVTQTATLWVFCNGVALCPKVALHSCCCPSPFFLTGAFPPDYSTLSCVRECTAMASSFSLRSAPHSQARLIQTWAFRPTSIVNDTKLSASHPRSSTRFSRFTRSGRFGEQSCVPCEGEGGPQALTLPQAEEHLASLQSGWEIEHDEQKRLFLSRLWKTKNFLAALELSRRFGEVAEREGHHPDVHITGWNRLKLVLWTHSRNGLTINDFVLAAKLDDVDMQGLLWKKKKVENL